MHHYSLKTDPNSSHQQITRRIKALNRSPILDVGSAQGIFGQLLAGSDLTIDAIEPNPQWAEAARPFYRTVHACTVEQAPTPAEKYAAVICGDVLEHVVDPVSVLKQLVCSAQLDAQFMISLPNVAHLAVRMMLLFGRFPKMSRGILDRTHLHHFTRDTARQMIGEAGLRVIEVRSTPVPLRIADRAGVLGLLGRVGMALQNIARSIFPRLFAMQWLFIAVPDGEL